MSRARVYRHDLCCPLSGSNWTPKDGHSRGKRTYHCRDCRHRFTPEGNRHYFPETTRRQALDMYAEGAGIAATGRVLGVKPATVFLWVKKSLPGPEPDGADEPDQGGAATGEAFAPGDFLRRDVGPVSSTGQTLCRSRTQ